MYETFEKLLKDHGLRIADVAKATGISYSSFTDWKAGRYTPKADKRQKIADFFNVPLEYLDSGEMPDQYYLNPETEKIAQEIFDDKNYRILFDAARGSRPEDLLMAAELLNRLKETNPDG